MELTLTPLAFLRAPVRVQDLALALSQVVLVLSFVLFAVRPDIDAEAVSAVILEVAFICSSISEHEQPFSIHFVVVYLASVLVPIFPDDASVTRLSPFDPVPFIKLFESVYVGHYAGSAALTQVRATPLPEITIYLAIDAGYTLVVRLVVDKFGE